MNETTERGKHQQSTDDSVGVASLLPRQTPHRWDYSVHDATVLFEYSICYQHSESTLEYILIRSIRNRNTRINSCGTAEGSTEPVEARWAASPHGRTGADQLHRCTYTYGYTKPQF